MANKINISDADNRNKLNVILRKSFQSANINFLIGSGCSCPAIKPVGDIEQKIQALLDEKKKLDAEENVTSYTYDAANRLTLETYEDSTTRSFTYDAVGNLATRTDQKGQATTYSYDVLNQTTGVDYPGSNDNAFTYDDAGNLLTANNQNAAISLTYDNAYRVTQSVQNTKTVSYSYDIPNRTKTITYPGGKVVKEVKLENDLLASVKNSSNQSIVEYGYDDANRLDAKSYLNGITTGFTNNANGWITDLTYNPSQMIRFQYSFNKEGNRLYEKKLHSLSSSEQYIYDAKYRLTQFKRGTLDGSGNIPSPVTQTAYNLDAVGNWTSKTTDGVTENRTHNAMNELVNIDGSTLTYDDNGNLTDDGTNTYEYDYENRLTKVTRKSDSFILGQYKYDALGRRVEKQASGVTTAYYYDDNRIVEEQVSGATTATYVYGADIDEVISMERGGSTYYYLANSLGSIAALTNSSGSILEQYSYDAYGQPSITSSAYGNPYMFTGRQRDSESSLQYNRNRYLSHSLGRWTTHDPIGYDGGLNLYEYVASNPINHTDPFGLIQGEKKYKCCGQGPDVAWKTVDVRVHIYSGANNTSARDVRFANDIWEQCCIKVKRQSTTRHGWLATILLVGFDRELEIAPQNQPRSSEEIKLINKQVQGTVQSFYFHGFDDSGAGILGITYMGTGIFAVHNNKGFKTWPHELGHVLGLGEDNSSPDKLMAQTWFGPKGTKLNEADCDAARTSGYPK